MKCLVCDSSTSIYYLCEKTSRRFFQCQICKLVFLDPGQRLSGPEEKDRYSAHENDVADFRYQEFVKPLFQQITQRFPMGTQGLDFGCGEGPVLSHLLKQAGYTTDLYDPFFHDDPHVFSKSYDFVFCVEVIEHLFDPLSELRRLRGLLKSTCLEAGVGVMTMFLDESIDFGSWFYKNDPTHVVFFSEKSCAALAMRTGFASFKRTGPRTGWFNASTD